MDREGQKPTTVELGCPPDVTNQHFDFARPVAAALPILF